MRSIIIFCAAALTTGVLHAQSNPSWWKYVPPDSTTLVGIRWETAHSTFFSEPLAHEIGPSGALGFPGLAILGNAKQLVIGGPSMVAIANGSFPLDQLRTQAAALGFQRARFLNAELWISPDPAISSVAYITERLLLIGPKDAITRSLERVADPSNREYSPLMARGARYSEEDLWIVASRLPDTLGSLFLPISIDARSFEGSVSVWEGLHLVASIERSSPIDAAGYSDELLTALDARPAMAEGTQVIVKDRSVLVRMDLDEEQLYASMRVTPSTTVAAAIPAANEGSSGQALSGPGTARQASLPPLAPAAAPIVITATIAPPQLPPLQPEPSNSAAHATGLQPELPPMLPRTFATATLAARNKAADPRRVAAATPLTATLEFPTGITVALADIIPARANPVLPPAPPKRIRIMGLDGGPREILLNAQH